MPVKNCFFGWHCWRTVESLAQQLPRLPWESVGWACAPSSLASLIHFAWLNSRFQHRDCLYLLEVINSINWSHTISKLASGAPLLSCAAVILILEKIWKLGARKNAPTLGACWRASKKRCLTVLPNYKTWLGTFPVSNCFLILQSAVWNGGVFYY